MYRRNMQPLALSRTYLDKRRNANDFKDGTDHDGEAINMLQMVHDAFYYMGFMQIAKYAVFLVMGIILMLFHVNAINVAPNTAYFRTSVTNRLATTPFPDGPSWDDVNSFHDAADYFRDTLERMINTSTDAAIPEPTVMIGEYGKVLYARIVANFEENCKLAQKRGGVDCWRDPSATVPTEAQNVTRLFKLGPPKGPPPYAPAGYNVYDHWHTTYSRYFSFRAGSHTDTNWQAFVAITVDPNSTRQDFLNRMQLELSDLHLQLLGRYTYLLGLDIIAQNSVTGRRENDDYAIFSLRVQRSKDGQGDVDRGGFNKLSTTTPGHRQIYASKKDGGRKVVEVIFWLIFFWILLLDIVQFKLARRQGVGVFTYFTHFWNIYNWLVNLALLGWLIAYFVLWAAWAQFYASKNWPLVPNTCNDFFRYEVYSAYYTRWVYSGVGLLVFVGLRMVQFSRLHPGVAVFHQILGRSIRDLMDFLVVFVFLLVLLGTCVFLIFQTNGGNSNWLTWWSGASMLSRLAFQQAGYEDMYNGGIGTGPNAFVITAIFWICIAVLFVFSGNIFLSAVSYAYGAARDQNPQVETFFAVEILYRIFFGVGWVFWMLFGYRSFEKSHKSISILKGAAPVDKSLELTGAGLKPSASSSSHDSAAARDVEAGEDVDAQDAESGKRSRGSGLGDAAARDQADAAAQGCGGCLGSSNDKLGSSIRVAAQKGGEHAVGAYRGFFNTLLHKPDVNYYRMFMPKDPARFPRLYMLARWAIASRPEARALATYFIDFRKFGLCTATRRRNKNSPYDPFHLPPLRHIPIRREGEEESPVDWDHVDDATLKELMAKAKESHDRLLDCAFIPVILPSWLTKLFLGYFWMDYHTTCIPAAAGMVYDPEYMRQIESSFAIDEDEERALPTISDLRNEVENMKMELQESMRVELAKLTEALRANQLGI